MALVSLPPDTPLMLARITDAQWRHGRIQVVPQAFPAVGAMGAWGLPPGEPARLFPVLLSDTGLFTDPDWRVFSEINELTQGNPAHQARPKIIEFLLRSSKGPDGSHLFGVCCPALEGPRSVAGTALALARALVLDRQTSSESFRDLQQRLVAWARTAERTTLDACADPDATLLDRAMAAQYWPLAETLWRRGVRWSDGAVAQGAPLCQLVLGTPQFHSTLSSPEGPWHDWPADQRVAAATGWLDRWLGRWTATGATLPETPFNSHRHDQAVNNGFTPDTRVLDTPMTLWMARPVETTGAGAIPLERATPQAQALLDRWAAFWAGEGIQLEDAMLPNAIGPPQTLEEAWGTRAPGWAARALTVAKATRLQARLEPGAPGAARPRL